ncbi:hypothetical protein F5Y18DRAFT_314365 [Xylariaceae sp. FL1019]|nr:hypothetical protein F5Y18DRAFT_314365 [Xylariaceae sp. FL1019]
MFDQFEWHHLPALISAFACTAGVIWPTTSPRRSLLAFGFPARVADSPAAAPVMVIAQARTTTVGVAMLVFYSRGQMEAVDTLLATYSIVAGFFDSYTLWGQGETRKALYRLTAAGVFGACGLAGVTARRQLV